MALPRTIVWLPRRLPHPLEATGSTALICKVRSNAGTCGCSDNLSKKQVQGIDQQLLPARSRSAGNLHQFRGLRRRGWRGRSEGMTGRHTRQMPASTVRPLKSQPTAIVNTPGGEGLARAAPEDASLPSIERTAARNSDELQAGAQAAGPRPRVRVVWPVPVSEAPPPAVESGADTKNQSARLAEADTPMHADNESAVRTSEGTGGTSRIGQLAVLVFLLLGLPGAGILAWLVMKADNVRGEQLAGNHHLRSNPADDRGHNNKRRTGGLDDQREADWIDAVLARFAEHPTTSVRNAALTSTAPVQRSSEVTEAVLRDVMIALRNKMAAQCDSGSYAVAGR